MARDIDDYTGHALLNWLKPGAVDSRQHNVQSNGDPYGDCYKCRRVAEFVRVAVLGEENEMWGTFEEEQDRAHGAFTDA